MSDTRYIHDLCHALQQQKQSDILALLTVGRDYNIPDKSGHTALYYASAHHDLENVEKLLWNGARIDNGGNKKTSPLLAVMQTATDKSTDHANPVIDMLLQAGANTNVTDHKDQTPLMHAKTPAQVANLLEYKADPNMQDQQGKTVLHQFLSKYLRKSTSQVENQNDLLKSIACIAKSGADIYIKDQMGQTPYAIAMQCDNRQLQQIFLNAKDSMRTQKRQAFNQQADNKNQHKSQKLLQTFCAKKRPLIFKRKNST